MELMKTCLPDFVIYMSTPARYNWSLHQAEISSDLLSVHQNRYLDNFQINVESCRHAIENFLQEIDF